MGIAEAVFLGLLQGLTEFLPISSSGHLSLLQYFLGLKDVPKFFDVMLHVGTLAAVVFYYRSSLWRATAEACGTAKSNPDADDSLRLPPIKTACFLILATLPAVGAAAFFRPTKLTEGQSLESVDRSWRNRVGDLREYSAQRPRMVLGFLGCTSVLLIVAARKTGGTTNAASMHWTQALGIGIAQAISALCPGMSRSGLTISTGLLLGMQREWAVHFSLLMSIPAILGAAVLKTLDVDPAWLTSANLIATLAGTIVSAIVGWVCITLLLGSIRRGRWWWFSIYLWLLIAGVGIVLAR